MSSCILKSVSEKLKLALERGEITPDKIALMLPEDRTALKALLEEVVTERLGLKVSTQEVEHIAKISKKIDIAEKNLKGDLGNPTKLKENLDFWVAKKEMDDYLMSKNPTHNLRIATGTVGRAMMLASVKSPILNIGSNIEVGLTESIARRISNFTLKGTDNKLAVDYVKMVNTVYQKTGYDVSRMMNIEDVGASGARVLGEDMVHAQGPGLYRKGARVVEDVVFKQLMGAPDVAFSSFHFADSVNLNSAKMFKGNKAKQIEAMTDAMRIDPVTPEGIVLRSQAILDAQTATWTNDTWASKMTQGLRNVFNKATGDVRAGDLLFPFIKTPANVIATGMDYAGAGIPKALFKTYKAIKNGEADKQVIQSIVRDLTRAGLGLTGAAVIVGQLKEEDFVGAYDPARTQIEQLRNSNYNAIRVGNKWISTDWLGPLAVPVTAMMYAKKYGKAGNKEKGFQYAKGVGSAFLNLPVISDAADYFKQQVYQKNQNLDEMTQSSTDYLTNFATSRLWPSIFSDTANALDPIQRQTGKGLQSFQAKVPLWRNKLPEKKNIFGETIKGEPAWSEILFGSRLKTDRETSTIKEIDRVSRETEKSVKFTDWDKSSIQDLVQFKNKFGDATFNEAKIKYGEKLKTGLDSLVNNSKYNNLSDSDKLKEINDLDSTVMDKIFKQYNFKKKTLPANPKTTKPKNKL